MLDKILSIGDNNNRMKFFSSFLLVISFLLVFVSTVFAQESTMSSILIDPPVLQASSYILPYPGILPNNPFYFLKTARDRIISFLISDPTKKADFDILQADKRLNAAVFLFNLGNQSLAETTIAKGENYFDDALSQIGEAKQQGLNITDVVNKLSLSLSKHKEVLKSLQKKAINKAMKEKLVNQRERIVAFEKRLSIYVPKEKK